MKPWLLPLLVLSATAGCDRAAEQGSIRVSVIGGAPTLADPNRKAPDTTQRVLLGAVGEGLVAYDEAGQIAPALAQRWIVTSDGLSAIFRLRPIAWPDGDTVRSADATRRIRAMLASNSRNPLRTAFDSLEEINPTTPEVIEFRLTTPRPPLMELLAQPEAVILRKLAGTGPFRIAERNGATVQLAPREEPTDGAPAHSIALTGERAALAVARFMADGTDLVLGGSYRDWPLLAVAEPQARAVRIDPADGLFGLLVQRSDGFLADPANRQTLAMVIDRDALLAAFNAPGWQGVLRVLPQRYRSAAEPALPAWAALDLAGRIAGAQSRVAAWEGEPVQLRVYLPDGPGSTLVFGRLQADWQRIGISAVRSDLREADLRLIDEVAPAGSALWYLSAVACPARQACATEAKAALELARASQSLAERGAQLATADRLIADSGLYIPLARPLRWSLVTPRLTLFRENARAYHPLHRLIRPPR